MQEAEQPVLAGVRAARFLVKVAEQFTQLLHERQVERVHRAFGLEGDVFFAEQRHEPVGLPVFGVDDGDFLGRCTGLDERLDLGHHVGQFAKAILVAAQKQFAGFARVGVQIFFERFVELAHGAQGISGDQPGGAVEDGLRGAVVFRQHHDLESGAVALVEVEQIPEPGALKLVDALVIVADDEGVGRFPEFEQATQQVVLGAVGVLKFVHLHVQVALLIRAQQRLVLFEGPQHPQNHVLVLVAAGALHRVQVLRVQVGGGFQAFHTRRRFGNNFDFRVAFAGGGGVAPVQKIRIFGQPFHKIVGSFQHESGRPILLFHGGKQVAQVVFIGERVFPTLAQRVLGREFGQQFAHDFNTLQIGHRLKVSVPEILHVFLNHAVAKPVKRTDRYPVGVGADHVEQAGAHGVHAGIGEREAQDVLRTGVGFEQDFAHTGSQNMRFAGARPGYHQHRPFDGVHGAALPRVERVEEGAEGVVAGKQNLVMSDE